MKSYAFLWNLLCLPTGCITWYLNQYTGTPPHISYCHVIRRFDVINTFYYVLCVCWRRHFYVRITLSSARIIVVYRMHILRIYHYQSPRITIIVSKLMSYCTGFYNISSGSGRWPFWRTVILFGPNNANAFRSLVIISLLRINHIARILPKHDLLNQLTDPMVAMVDTFKTESCHDANVVVIVGTNGFRCDSHRYH